MGQVHQKGKLNTPFEEKTRRSATLSSGHGQLDALRASSKEEGAP